MLSLAQLDAGDEADAREAIDRTAVKAALQQLRSKHADNLTNQALMQEQSLEQFVVGEADAKMMRTHQRPRVAYNIQTAVDDEHCLILHHEVTQDCTDNQQLKPMATQRRPCWNKRRWSSRLTQATPMASSYADITAFVPPNRAVNTQGDGQHYERSAFSYDESTDSYQCPAGKVLQLKQLNRGNRIYAASAQDCARCPLKSQCPKPSNVISGDMLMKRRLNVWRNECRPIQK